MIAVLPLENATGDDANDYLSAGVADSLVTSLASLPTVTVLSRAAVNDARERRTNPSDIARDLDATFVVAGSVQRAGAQVRLALNLLRQDGSVAWADAVEGPADGVFAMQARLAGALGSALSVQMSATERARLNTPPTSNTDALDAYWRGRALLERRDTPGNLQRAVVAFNEALRLDARFVDAHAALAEADWELYDTTRETQYVEAAVLASKNAVALAPDDAGVRVALGVTLTRGGRNAEAVQELQRALAVEPNHDEARRYLGRALAALGRIDEAVAEWRKALVLRPNNWQVLSDMGLALYQATRYDESEAAYRQLITLQPDNVIGFQMLGTVNQVRGRNDEALAFYEQAIAISPVPQALSNMGALYHERGDYARAVDAYRRAIEQRPNAAATHRNLGDSLLRLGRTRRGAGGVSTRRGPGRGGARRQSGRRPEPGLAGGVPAEGRRRRPPPPAGSTRRCAGRRPIRRSATVPPWSMPSPGAPTRPWPPWAGRWNSATAAPTPPTTTNSRACARMPGSWRSCAPDPQGVIAGRHIGGVSLRTRYPFVIRSQDMSARVRVKYATIFVFPRRQGRARHRECRPRNADGPSGRHRGLDGRQRDWRRFPRQGLHQVEGEDAGEGRAEGIRPQGAGRGAGVGQEGHLPLQHPHRRRRGVRPRARGDELSANTWRGGVRLTARPFAR